MLSQGLIPKHPKLLAVVVSVGGPIVTVTAGASATPPTSVMSTAAAVARAVMASPRTMARL